MVAVKCLFSGQLLLSSWVGAQISSSSSSTSVATPPVYTSETVPPITKDSTENDKNYVAPYFPLLGFKKYEKNPILAPNPANNWESAYLYNPSAIVIDDKVWLLYRAQNKSKTSTIGLAWSNDGYNFTRYNKPILTPTEPYEIPGGCEDPRVIRVNGTFYMTYTSYDNHTARLCMATSTDLVNWNKHGPILPNVTDVVWRWDMPQAPTIPRMDWSKSGAIIPELQPGGVYHMHFGDSFLYYANSTDLLNWKWTPYQTPYAAKLNVWEQSLMESAGPPIKTRDGMWLKIYNGVGIGIGGSKPAQYNTGQMLIDPIGSPFGPPIARLETPLLSPSDANEVEGQVDNVVFTEGLVQFHGKWFMYFGQGDQYLGTAVASMQP